MIELYPHNQKAYENAIVALTTSDRTCIIHPTGTGKSLIIARFIEDNPGKKHLVLAPGVHIRTEIEKHTSASFIFYTYTYTGLNAGNITGFDFIYADEFHRIGAEIWGGAFQEIIKQNPSAKIIGTSATNIRFLDDNRDMATEIFKDNIASSISLSQAIMSGMLKKPVYVLGYYDLKLEISKLKNKIENSGHPDKENIISEIKANEIDWEKVSGLEAILKKHISADRKKMIVFCRNRKHLNQVKYHFSGIFKKIYGDNFKVFEIYSLMKTTVNTTSIEEFTNTKYPAALFTIDMVNEGLHVKNNDTVILVRDTSSPILYYQQIGRAFSVAQKRQPMIFDLVQNVANLAANDRIISDFSYESGSILGNRTGKRHTLNLYNVDFFDEVKDFSEIHSAFSNKIENWEIMFAELKKYYVTQGNIKVQYNKNRSLANWLMYMRKLRKKDNLSQSKMQALDDMGMIWDNRISSQTYKNMFEAHIKENGSLPKNRDENKKVYDAVNRIKFRFKNGRLAASEIETFSKFFDLEKSLESDWNKNYELARRIFEKEGYFLLKKSDPDLGQWMVSQKKMYRDGRMPAERLDLLNAINFVFDTNDFAFKRGLEALFDFYKSKQRLPKTTDDKTVYTWLNNIRVRFKEGKLTDQQIKQLNKIPNWSTSEDILEAAIEKHSKRILEHYKLHGNLKRKNGDALTMSINYVRNVKKRSHIPYELKQVLEKIPGLFI